MTKSSRNRPDKMLGRILNDTYKLEQTIGSGGMGRVYSARHLRLSRPVAVKVLLSKFSSNPDAVERFRLEARSASALGHPNIIQVFDFNKSEDNHWYIVMELLEGEDLRTRLRREKRLGPITCLPILQQVCDALDLAHSKGLVHRDLKPSNIFLSELGARTEVKLLDFGVAKMLGTDLGLTMDGTMLGTPHYMAPEQGAGEVNLTSRVDIYSIGTVLFEMLTGRRPFEADSPLSILHLRATRPPPAPSSIVPTLSQRIDDVIIRALAREPAERFESPAQMALAFGKAVADAPQERTTYTIFDTTSTNGPRDPESEELSTENQLGENKTETGRTGETIQALVDGSGSSSIGASSSSVIQLKSTDELRMATILVISITPLERDEEDPDGVLEIIESLLKKLADTIRDHGGTIEKDIGDTLTAVFGVPVATGDDPVHAVRAGLAARIIGRRNLNHGVETCIGIQTGRILKRSGRTGVTGEVVKVANKLADECPPGDVLVGHQTFVHIRGRFDVSFRDELRIRGQKQPLRTYRVTGERDHGVVLEPRGQGEGEAPLIGREVEKDFLRGLYSRASRESQAQVVLVLGERGMGATRLAHEFISTLEEHSERMSFFPASAGELAAPTPYGVLSEIIRVKAGTSPGMSREEAEAKLMDLISWPFSNTGGYPTSIVSKPVLSAREIVRTLGSAIGVQVVDENIDGGGMETSPEKLALAIATYLRTLSRHQPIVITLDDLHQSDEESIELLELMMRQLEDAPVMLLCLARPEFTEKYQDFMASFEHFTTLLLHSLSAAAVTALVNALLNGMAPPGLGPDIHKRSGGNPHLAEEMVAHLRERGDICREDESGVWVVLGDLEDLHVPSRAEALLQARLDQLPRDARELLRCAAVVGSNFWEDTLRSLGLERVESRLDSLIQTDLVRLRPTSRFPNTRQWAFKSELMAEVARGNLPTRDRRQLHVAVADWLGTQDQRDPDTLSLRAHHLVLAGKRSAALDLMAEAGRLAERQQRWEVALANYIRAHELAASEGDEASSLYYAIHVGRLGVRAHTPNKCVPLLEKSAKRAEESGDEAMQTNLLQLLGRNLAIQGDKVKAREISEKAHEIAERRDDLRLRFETAKALGFVYYYGDEFADAARVFEQCISMANELKDDDEVAMNIHNVADSALSAGDFDRALEFADRAVEASVAREKVSFLHRSARGISAYVRAFKYNDTEAFADLKQWIAYADERNYLEQQLDARYYLASALAQQGQRKEALEIVRSGVAMARESEGEQSRRKMVKLLQEIEGTQP